MAAPAAAQSALPPDPTVIGNVEAVRACLSVGDYLRKLGSVAAVSEEQGDAAAEARRLEASARYLNAVRLLKVIGGPESRRIAGDAQGGVPWVESLAYLCAERGDCDEGKAEAAVEVALSLEAACAREYRTGR
ncbi:MAG: hypothetical protein AAF192_12420 [Pseudomonadota bacterium]